LTEGKIWILNSDIIQTMKAEFNRPVPEAEIFDITAEGDLVKVLNTPKNKKNHSAFGAVVMSLVVVLSQDLPPQNITPVSLNPNPEQFLSLNCSGEPKTLDEIILFGQHTKVNVGGVIIDSQSEIIKIIIPDHSVRHPNIFNPVNLIYSSGKEVYSGHMYISGKKIGYEINGFCKS
jgi:hypothetical protein